MDANFWIIVSIAGAVVFLAALAFFINRNRKHEIDYRALFILGVVWLPLGVSTDSPMFWAIGLALIAIGLANRDKWKKQKKWSEMSKSQKKFMLTLTGLLVVLLLMGVAAFLTFEDKGAVSNFDECVKAGNPVMESYPRQCRDSEGNLFVETVGNELGKLDLIRINNPRPNQVIESPLTVEGEARGTWFFEGDSPVILVDWDGRIIAESFVTAQGEWMTEDFVPFKGEIYFEKPEYGDNGTLILRKDNPSGLPEHDDALEIPIYFSGSDD